MLALAVASATACGSTVPLADRSAGALQGQAPDLSSAPLAAGEVAPDESLGLTTGETPTGPAAEAGDDPSAPTAGVRGLAPGPRTSRQPVSAPSTGGRPAPTSGGQAAADIPERGRGWDASSIRIGVTTQQDAQAVAEGLGVNTLDTGDQAAVARAVAADLNARGGLFGRKIVIEVFDLESAGNDETQGQAACENFTQDKPVVAVYAMAAKGDVPSFRACLAKAKIPVFAGGVQAFDNKIFRDLDSYYHLMTFPSWNRFARPFLQRLVAQGYYTGWDTARGAPGPNPVKTGALCPDTSVGRRVGSLIAAASRSVGKPLSFQAYYAPDGTDISGLVLRFRSDGITHVLFCDAPLLVFAQQAESQRYRPRYGISSFNVPIVFLQGLAPNAQLAGSLGVGFAPTLDVDAQRDPGKAGPAGEAACRAVGERAGIRYERGKRLAQGILYDTCDVLALIVEAAKAAGSLTGTGIRDGVGVAGPKLVSAYTYASGLSATQRAHPAAIRDLAFATSCNCYGYRGGLVRLP